MAFHHSPGAAALQLVVRRAVATDLPVVLVMDSTDDHMARAAVNAEARLLGKITAGDIFLAFLGDTAVGYLRYDSLWPEMVPLLAWMWVRADYRGQGIFKVLLQYADRELVASGVSSVLVSAHESRPAMVERLRQECGGEAGRLRFENGTEEVFFWRSLRKL